jgi:hypothetical protein
VQAPLLAEDRGTATRQADRAGCTGSQPEQAPPRMTYRCRRCGHAEQRDWRAYRRHCAPSGRPGLMTERERKWPGTASRAPIICCSCVWVSVPVPSADLHLWNMVLAVAAAGTSVAAADGGLLARFQSNAKASVIITSFSFAMYVAARITRAAPRASRPRNPSGVITGWYVRQDGEPGRRAVRMPTTRTTHQEPNSVSRDGRYRAARREPVPRRRV